ncbi:hypothetical protein Ahy_B01g056268 [Arachis hypogaea]|uniref:Aminotransferase-like plant mobile domain-containing protein n=1 Tax=Arachis hypogaea TaxID=3818 RepID=A0A445AYH5_ARAHY|nr:hypothetical protein Ahy_B01g056268 [Arachis hypogaea]
MSHEKKGIVQELGFGGLMHIPPMNVLHKLLKELAYSLNLIKPHWTPSPLFPGKVKFQELSEEDKEVFRSFQGTNLKQLTNSMMEISVDGDEDRLKFKRTFSLYIQMSFLLPTTINKVSLVHIPLIFCVDTIREWNWGGHVLNFLIKGISENILKKKKVVDSCLYALMIVYFHESTHKNKPVDTIPRPPWLQHWTRELLGIVKRAQLKDKLMRIKKEEKKEKKKKPQKKKNISSESDSVTDSESDSEQDSEGAPKIRKQPTRKAKKFKEPQESLNEPAPILEAIIGSNPQEKIIILQKETHSQSEPLDILPLQIFAPPSETTASSPLQKQPTIAKSPSEEYIEEAINATPQPHEPDETHQQKNILKNNLNNLNKNLMSQ